MFRIGLGWVLGMLMRSLFAGGADAPAVIKLYSAAALAAVAAAGFGFFKLLPMIVISGTSSIGNALFRG